jgi:hypothetical protein
MAQRPKVNIGRKPALAKRWYMIPTPDDEARVARARLRDPSRCRESAGPDASPENTDPTQHISDPWRNRDANGLANYVRRLARNADAGDPDLALAKNDKPLCQKQKTGLS